MSPTPDEIAFVLAAPEPVREALRGVAGPGWSFSPSRDVVIVQPDAQFLAKSYGWLPVDPTAIAEAAARAAHQQGKAPWWGGPPLWEVQAIPDGEGALARVLDVAGCHAPSARLAALRLLAAVVEVARG